MFHIERNLSIFHLSFFFKAESIALSALFSNEAL